MTQPGSSNSGETSLTHDLVAVFRYYVGIRRGLLLLGVGTVATALALNWTALAAAGIAPLILGVLPCVVMCGLGLCMSKLGGKSCSSSPEDDKRTPPDRDEQ